MNVAEEFQLQEYQDLGPFEEYPHIRMKRHPQDGRICLEKRVPLGQERIYRLLQEICVAGVPEIFLCVQDGEELIVVEKYIEGKTIETLLAGGPMEWKQILPLTEGICETLKSLHQAEPPMICRDLKAENIVIDDDGKPWLVDFDIARIFVEGKKRDTELLGTAEYAAPEQFGFFQTDQRTDIYSLGILMNYMATGKFPVEKMAQGRMGDIVGKCTHLAPDQRYQSIEELQKDLLQLRRDLGMETQETREALSYALPGFRTGRWGNRIGAGLVYGLLTWFCFTLPIELEGVPLSGLELWIERLVLWLSQFLFILLLFRYRGWGKKVPLLRSRNLILRTVGLVAAWWFLVSTAAVICVLKNMWFF